MMSPKCKKYAGMMVIGTLLNYLFYFIAHIFHLPIWMDTIGTMYVAIILEPAAGLLIGLATNFMISAVVYGPSSLMYYFVAAIAALSVGILIRKNGKITMGRLPMGLLCYLVFGTIISTIITMVTAGGVSNSVWEHNFFNVAHNAGMPVVISCMFGAFVLKVADCVAALILVPILYKLTPQGVINQELHENLSWKASFLKRG